MKNYLRSSVCRFKIKITCVSSVKVVLILPDGSKTFMSQSPAPSGPRDVKSFRMFHPLTQNSASDWLLAVYSLNFEQTLLLLCPSR